MKLRVSLFAVLFGLLFLTTDVAIAQSIKPEDRPASEQSLKDLVNEVRQLRAMLQRVNQTVYKTNIAIERLKFQQDQVSRLSRELDSLRESLAETRAQVSKFKDVMGRVETDIKNGFRNPDELTSLKEEVEVITQRELRLAQKETQLMNDLSMERSKLLELTEKLNTLELELTPK